MEVLRLLAAGSPDQRIADELVVTLHTVKKHVTPACSASSARPTAPRRSPGARQLGLIA
jgi:DNA-binding NarL/FixJ family response regulator